MNLGRICQAVLAKRTAGEPLSEAERQQRKEAAQARWGYGTSAGIGAGVAGGAVLAADYGRDVGEAFGLRRFPKPRSQAQQATDYRAGMPALLGRAQLGRGTNKETFLGAALADLQGGMEAGDDLTSNRAGFNAPAHRRTPLFPGTQPTKLWRGASGKAAEQFMSAKPGDEINLDVPTSWSRDRSVASHFTTYDYTAAINQHRGPKAKAPRMHHQSAGAQIRQAARLNLAFQAPGVNPDVPEGAPRVRIRLEGADKLGRASDIEHAADAPSLQQEVLVGRDTKLRVKKVKNLPGNVRVVTAEVVGQAAKPGKSYLWRRLLKPGFHGGRLARAGVLATSGALAGLEVAGMQNSIADLREASKANKSDAPMNTHDLIKAVHAAPCQTEGAGTLAKAVQQAVAEKVASPEDKEKRKRDRLARWARTGAGIGGGLGVLGGIKNAHDYGFRGGRNMAIAGAAGGISGGIQGGVLGALGHLVTDEDTWKSDRGNLTKKVQGTEEPERASRAARWIRTGAAIGGGLAGAQGLSTGLQMRRLGLARRRDVARFTALSAGFGALQGGVVGGLGHLVTNPENYKSDRGNLVKADNGPWLSHKTASKKGFKYPDSVPGHDTWALADGGTAYVPKDQEAMGAVTAAFDHAWKQKKPVYFTMQTKKGRHFLVGADHEGQLHAFREGYKNPDGLGGIVFDRLHHGPRPDLDKNKFTY